MRVMKHFIIVSIFLFFSTNVFAKDFYRYFAFGEATGTYEEKRFDLDKDIDSTSYVYGNLYFPKKDLLSSTVFAQLTQFSLDVKDAGQRRHELDVLLLGLNWGRGLAGTIDVGDSNIVLDASAFLGAGLIRASKKITNSSSEINYINQPEFHEKVQNKDFWMENNKLKQLGFNQTISLEKIVEELCE